MASLDFKLEDAGAHSFEKKPSVMSTLKSKLGPGTYEPYKLAGKSGFAFNKVFPVLRDFLQPDTTLSLESAAQSILENLPENAPMSNQVYTFCTLCFELAEQIPYNHPSQVKFARLLEYMGQSTRVTQIDTSKGKASKIVRYQLLGEIMSDGYLGPEAEPEDPNVWVNYNAFIANLYSHHVFDTDPTYAIWTLRDALETENENSSIREAWILAAAQWIIWDGQSLFKHILSPGKISPEDLQSWRSGPLYEGKQVMSLERWRFWKERFGFIAGEEKVGDECKTVAAKATNMMGSIEENMMF